MMSKIPLDSDSDNSPFAIQSTSGFTPKLRLPDKFQSFTQLQQLVSGQAFDSFQHIQGDLDVPLPEKTPRSPRYSDKRTSLKIVPNCSPLPIQVFENRRDLTFGDNPQEVVKSHLEKITSDLQSLGSLKNIQRRSLKSEYLPQSDKKLLLIELDQTLLETSNSQKDKAQAVRINLGKETTNLWVRLRPNSKQFLETLQEFYLICVFSNQHEEYIRKILRLIDPKSSLINGIFCQDNCILYKGKYVKDLSIIKNYSLKDMVIVDHNVISYCLHLDNGIPLLPWKGNPDDDELLPLMQFLASIVEEPDLRKPLREHFDLKNLLFSCDLD